MSSLRYRPALTGIRAVAVGGVLAAHASVPHLGGGIWGVDVFFVLSGYLITGILVGDVSKRGRLDLRTFYRNRALRLLPALGVMLLVGLVFYRTFSNDGTLGGYGLVVLTSVFYCQNVVSGALGHPFGGFGHTWSLAMEEQFYLLWPLALAWLLRHRRALVPATVAAIAVSWGVLALTTTPRPGNFATSYFWPWNRVGGLLLGCLLALTVPRWSTHRRAARIAAIPASVLLVAVFVVGGTYETGRGVVWLIPLSALVTAALIVSIEASPDTAVARLLSWRPIVWVGEISYGLYLLHVAIFHLTAEHWHHSRAPLIAVETVLSLVAAAASFYLVERRFLRRKRSTAVEVLEPAPSRAADAVELAQ